MGFSRIPPEVNAGRLLRGPGAQSLADAAAQWDGLASTLRTVAACYETVSTALLKGWPGVRTAAVCSALAPYVVWLRGCAEQAANAATQAATAISAYEAAASAMTDLEALVSNRLSQVTLAATNCLAQAAPRIAQVEQAYDQMWVQNAEVMYTYARASAKAANLTPFTSSVSTITMPEPHVRDVLGRQRVRAVMAAPATLTAGRTVMQAIPAALEAFSTQGQTFLDAHLREAAPALSTLSMGAAPATAIHTLQETNRGMMLLRAAAMYATPQRDHGWGIGVAQRIGVLSVPSRWSVTTSDDAVDDNILEWSWEPLRLVKVSVTAAQSSR